MNVEDDLWPRRRPLQVASDSNPQLVDVRVLPVIRGDGQRVGNGKQLKGNDKVLHPIYCCVMQVSLFFFFFLKCILGVLVCRETVYLLRSILLWDQPVEL